MALLESLAGSNVKAILVVALLVWTSSVAIGSSSSPASVPAQTPTPQADQQAVAMQTRLDAIEKIANANNAANCTAIADTRNLLYVLLTTQFTIIIGFLGLVVWIERKIRKSVRDLNTSVTAGKAVLNSYFNSQMDDFQSQIDAACGSLLKARGGQELLLAGKVLFWTDKPEKALEALNTAIALDANNAETRKYRGLSYKSLGPDHLQDAIADLQEAVSAPAFSNDYGTLLALAQCYLALRKWPEAVDTAKPVAEHGNKGQREAGQLIVGDAFRGARRFREALEVYDALIAANPQCTPAIIRKGNLLNQKRDLGAVIDLYKTAISQRAGVSDYHAFLGAAYAKRDKPGDWELACHEFDEAERISQTNWNLWYHKGRAYLRRWSALRDTDPAASSLFAEAERCFRHGATIARTDQRPKFLNELVRLYLSSKRFEEAVVEARKSVAANPRFVQNHMVLCTALLAQKNWPEVLAAAQGGTRQAPSPPGKIWCQYFIVLAKALERHEPDALRGDIAAFLNLLEKAPYFDPSEWDWETTEEIIREDVSGLSTNARDLLVDLREAMADPGRVEPAKHKWAASGLSDRH